MQSLKRFRGKEVTLEGRIGMIVPPIHPDSHYRFIYRVDGEIIANVISAKSLIPKAKTNIHDQKDFKFWYRGKGIVGSIEHYNPNEDIGKLYSTALGEPIAPVDFQV